MAGTGARAGRARAHCKGENGGERCWGNTGRLKVSTPRAMAAWCIDGKNGIAIPSRELHG